MATTTARKRKAPSASRTRARKSPPSRGSTTVARGGQRLTHRTTDHDEIRRWAEERDGHPAMVKRTGRGRGDVGIIRIDFPGYSGAESLKEISWDDFFEKFEESNLALVYQEKTGRGQRSNFNKLVKRK